MKRLLFLLVLLWSLGVSAQPILRNSLTTNTLGTNLVWTPAFRFLEIFGDTGNPGVFAVNSNGISTAVIASDNGSVLPSLGIRSYLNLSGTTNRLTIASNVLLLDGVAIGGGGVSTAVTPLTWSGTNAVGFNCATNNMTYTLLLTNNVLLGSGTFTSLPQKTTNLFFTLGLQQDSTGGRVVSITNSVIAWADGQVPVIKTNAGSVSFLYFHTHTFTNSMLVGSPNLNVY